MHHPHNEHGVIKYAIEKIKRCSSHRKTPDISFESRTRIWNLGEHMYCLIQILEKGSLRLFSDSNELDSRCARKPDCVHNSISLTTQPR